MISLLMLGIMRTTAFAHGGHGRGNQVNPQPRHELCTVASCEQIGAHQHGDLWYCSQTGRTGSYAVCSVAGCTELGLHEHNVEYFTCQNHGTGLGRGKNRTK